MSKPSFNFLVGLAQTLSRVPDHDLVEIRRRAVGQDHPLVVAAIEREIERRNQRSERARPAPAEPMRRPLENVTNCHEQTSPAFGTRPGREPHPKPNY
jgi:hypothetical protein